jgi:DNA processing protein
MQSTLLDTPAQTRLFDVIHSDAIQNFTPEAPSFQEGTALPWQVYRGLLFALMKVRQLGNHTLRHLIETSWHTYHDPEWLLKATDTALIACLKTKRTKTPDTLAQAWLAHRPTSMAQAEEALEAELTLTQSQFMTQDDFPESLHHLYDAPLGLFLKGNASLLVKDVGGLAVVGTRHATPYGKEAVRWICQGLKHQGVVIWSGGARGIDTHAHQEALQYGLPTVAVMGCGFGTLYPKSNTSLFASILEAGGAWLTEYPSFIPPEGFRFPQRNRLVAALSDATLVVEAPKKSGSLITARLALEQGKTVLALPGNVFDVNSEGPHYLLAQGATPLTHPEELVHHVRSYQAVLPTLNDSELTTTHKPVSHEHSNTETSLTDTLSTPLQNLIWQQCHLTRPTHYDTLWTHLKGALPALESSALIEALLLMELDGLLQSLPGDHYCRQAVRP